LAIYVAAVDGMTSHDAADVTRLETIFLTSEGVVGVTGDDLSVEAQSSPDMTVKVNPGSCFVLRDAHVDNDNTLKFWHVIVTTSTNVTIPASDASNPRIDLICVKVDTGASPDATASNVATLIDVEGTAAASPTAPAVPNNHLKLAEISVPALDTTISSDQITDYRTFIGLQLPYAEGYRLKATGGAVDAQVYEDSDGNVIIRSARSGGAVKIDPSQNKVQVKGREGESYSSVASLPFAEEAVFDEEYDNGNSGAADTIDWTKGNKQKSTLTDDVTYTFTDPSGPCNLILHIVQDGTGGRDATWPASVTWLGIEPTWSDGGASKSIIVGFYYDGTTYWGQGTSWES